MFHSWIPNIKAFEKGEFLRSLFLEVDRNTIMNVQEMSKLPVLEQLTLFNHNKEDIPEDFNKTMLSYQPKLNIRQKPIGSGFTDSV